MRISEAVAETKDIEVKFGEATLHVTYRPLTYTVAEMDEMQADAKNTRRIIETVKRLVVKWDLTDDNEVPIPLDHPEDKYESEPLRHVGTHIFTEILKVVREDQSAGEAGKPSVAS